MDKKHTNYKVGCKMMSDVEKRKCRERVRRMGPAGQGRPHGGSEILEEMR